MEYLFNIFELKYEIRFLKNLFTLENCNVLALRSLKNLSNFEKEHGAETNWDLYWVLIINI